MTGEKYHYRRVALGGTFDCFHIGHEHLVSTAFKLGQQVLIGVTGDAYLRKNRKRHPVQPYASRVRVLQRFLQQKGWAPRASIFRLNDPYGPTARLRNLQALVITADTSSSAETLNKLRRESGMPPLRVHSVAFSRAEDGLPVSSTRIRLGEIDRNGRVLARRRANTRYSSAKSSKIHTGKSSKTNPKDVK